MVSDIEKNNFLYNELKEKISSLQDEITKLNTSSTTYDIDLLKYKNKLKEVSDKLQSLREDELSLTKELENTSSDIKLLEERKKYKGESLSKIDDIKDNIYIIKQSKFSRFPVYEKDNNNIIGIINVKDIIIEHKETDKIDLRNIIRPVTKFEHNEKIDDVFRFMQEKNESLCLVYNNKEFIGIVTIEDAVEEIVGNIYDEYDNV